MQQASLTANLVPPTPRELEAALARGVRTPMAALRAALEDLGQTRSRSGGGVVEGALRELFDLDKHLETLLEYVAPAELRPLRCSLEEIVRGSQDLLTQEDRERVLLASERDLSFLEVDGPILTRALARLVEETLREADGDVLLRAHQGDGCARFCIVEHPRHGSNAARSETEWEGLEVLLAHREITRMGGRVEVFDSANQHHRVDISLPCTSNPGGQE